MLFCYFMYFVIEESLFFRRFSISDDDEFHAWTPELLHLFKDELRIANDSRIQYNTSICECFRITVCRICPWVSSKRESSVCHSYARHLYNAFLLATPVAAGMEYSSAFTIAGAQTSKYISSGIIVTVSSLMPIPVNFLLEAKP